MLNTRKTLLAAIAAGLMTISAIPATAAPQMHQTPHQEQTRNDDRRDNGAHENGARDNGRRDTPAEVRARHVRACQARYRSYNPRTDRYTISRGRTAICRL